MIKYGIIMLCRDNEFEPYVDYIPTLYDTKEQAEKVVKAQLKDELETTGDDSYYINDNEIRHRVGWYEDVVTRYHIITYNIGE